MTAHANRSGTSAVRSAADAPGKARVGSFGAHLNTSDTLMWNIEKDPSLRTTIVAVSLLDRAPDWERLSQRMTDACELVPRLRERVVVMPMRLGPPTWQRDEHFDLTYHLRRIVAPQPADLRSVLDIAAPIAMDAFDKDRPLWEFTLVEGLEGGRAAFIQKIHHSFTDGIGAIAIARLLLDDQRNPVRQAPSSAQGESHHASGLTAAAEALTAELYGATNAYLNASRALPGIATRAVTDPFGLMSETARGVRSIGKLVAPVSKPLSTVMTKRGLSRRLDAFDVPLTDLLAAAHAADSSLNDAFLASVAGGMRRYHHRHGSSVESLRVTMPINMRRPDDPPGSNRFTPARFTLPVATVDAAERMRELGDLAKSWRKEPALPLTDAIAGVLNWLPVVATTSIFGSMLKAIDFVATNVPGLDTDAYLAGAKVVREYAFAPPSGAAFSIALLSHGDHCCVGINADADAVSDVGVLTACLREGFDEVLAVGSSE